MGNFQCSKMSTHVREHRQPGSVAVVSIAMEAKFPTAVQLQAQHHTHAAEIIVVMFYGRK